MVIDFPPPFPLNMFENLRRLTFKSTLKLVLQSSVHSCGTEMKLTSIGDVDLSHEKRPVSEKDKQSTEPSSLRSGLYQETHKKSHH